MDSYQLKTKPKRIEDGIQTAIVQRLLLNCLPGVYWFHPANGEPRSERTGAKLKRMGVRAGAPDLVFCIHGRFQALELKAPKGSMEPSQKEAARQISAADGIVTTAYGLDEALSVLVSWNILPADNPLSNSQRMGVGAV